MIRSRRGFVQSRRGAIAMMFALCLTPMVLLVALSIDFSFYTEARAQYQLAGDAAATYAIREATATYTLESAAKVDNATATSTAITAGQNAGAAWFMSQLATLPRAYNGANTPTVKLYANQNLSPSNPAGFTADVSYTGVYPPFFDGLFKRPSSNNWYVNGSSTASSSFSYGEVLVLLDTSGSMLIGANQSDINALDENTVCISSTAVPSLSAAEVDGMDTYYGADSRSAVDFTKVNNYNAGSSATASSNTSGTCNNTKNSPHLYNYNGGAGYANQSSGTPVAPCAFACHVTNTTPNGNAPSATNYTEDLYGIARSLNPHQTPSAQGGVTLRIDAVFAATENIINDMQNAEQVTGQFSIGVYQFNDNVSSIVAGNTNNGDANTEATSNLAGALTAVQADDWMHTPTETAEPELATNLLTGYTNFPLAIANLESGQLSNGTTTALHAAGNGSQSTGPEKFLFIVTDGLEDSTPSSTLGRLMGEMTGVNAETGSPTSSTPAICSYLKKTLGFTIYVLQVSYYPIPVITYYYSGYDNPTTAYTNQDFPLLNQSSGGNIENWVEGTNTGNTYQVANPDAVSPSPDTQALTDCASSPADIFQATSSSDIDTAMSQILKSALASTIRITD